jgi:hypothetical protein
VMAGCRVSRRSATRLTRKDYRAPCRNAAGSHRSRQTARRYGRVSPLRQASGRDDLICLKFRLRGTASFKLSHQAHVRCHAYR